MNKDKMVFIRCNEEERELFKELGRRLDRKYSDATRIVVREAVMILREQEAAQHASQPTDETGG